MNEAYKLQKYSLLLKLYKLQLLFKAVVRSLKYSLLLKLYKLQRYVTSIIYRS